MAVEIKFKSKFSIGQKVWLITDPEQLDRMIIAIRVDLNGPQYELGFSDSEPTIHFAEEISATKEVV